MKSLSTYLGIVAGAILVLFALANLQLVAVRFLVWQIELPLVLIVLGSGFLGIGAGAWWNAGRKRPATTAALE